MSAETKQPWTEGPWELGEENCGGGSNVRAVVAESADGAVVGWTARVVIAGDEVVSDAEATANAKIMAAAPEMAKALVAVVRRYDTATTAAAFVARKDTPEIAAARAALDLCGWQWGKP